MIKVITITLFLTAAASVAFYGFRGEQNLAQINDAVFEDILDEETDEAKLLPIAPNRTPYPQAQLQAAAYNNYLRLFGGERQIEFGLLEPVEGFKERITKKSYGIYITPATSPVYPDKFTGYHTGVDSEFSDITGEIPVRAITEGTIIVRTWAAGYGGVVVVKHYMMGVPFYALYGHLDKNSFPPAYVTQVSTGDQIGILGDDHSEETDGARKHLHFSIYYGEKPDFRGYVQTQEELAGWLNPLDFY